MGNFKYQISPIIPTSNFNTIGIFDDQYIHSTNSALDDFTEKRRALFILLSPYQHNITQVPYELTNMVLLGCVSAVESYIRKILRNIINVDKSSSVKCAKETIKYGVVLYHSDKNMLPEALLEGYSFANGNNIKEAVKKFTGINCESTEINVVLKEFSKICQLRHCIIHRFSLLGLDNAMLLGIANHKQYIEKPIKIDFDHLNEIVQVCENVVKVINNHLFCEVLERTYYEKTEIWYSDFRRDKKIFKRYYSLFKDSSVNIDEKLIYKEFIKTMNNKYGKDYPFRQNCC